MSEKIKLVLGIEIEGERLLLSEEAARQLYEKLKDIFENKVTITYVPWTYPVYVPQPIYVNPSWWTPITPTITWRGGTTGTTYSANSITCYSINS